MGKVAGFSLHAGVAAKAQQRDKLERLCHGTTHVIFEPLDFIARLAALVPKPRVNLTRFHGVFAPNSSLRSQVTPGRSARLSRGNAVKTASERHAAMSWAQRLKRVFRIDIETCRHCGGTVLQIYRESGPPK